MATAFTQNEPDLRRLYAALLASLALHAVLVAVPLLGVDVPVYRANLSVPARVLTARFYAETTAKTGTPNKRLQAAKVAEPERPKENNAGRKDAQSETDKPVSVAPKAEDPFLPADQLTKRPQPRDAIDFDMPELNFLSGSGSMIVNLRIDNLGNVVSVAIERSDLPNELSAAVAASLRGVHFEPGEMYGRPVGSIVKIEISHEIAPPPGQ